MINQELLRTFVCAANTETFAEAARMRHVTKSAVSQQIKTLETQLGVALFERIGRHARLTESGRELADVLRRQFAAIDDALESVSSSHRDVAGNVRIGSPRPFARVWLRGRIAQLLLKHRALRATIVFGTPSELEQLLIERALDFAILVRDPELPGIDARPIYTEYFAAYGAPAYLQGRDPPRGPNDFAADRFIVFDDDLPMHEAWWRCAFGPATPFEGTIVCRVQSLDEMLGLAEQGVGLVVLPHYFVQEALRRDTVVELPVTSQQAGSRATNRISLGWHKNSIESARFHAVRLALLE